MTRPVLDMYTSLTGIVTIVIGQISVDKSPHPTSAMNENVFTIILFVQIREKFLRGFMVEDTSILYNSNDL